ncbi:MAG: DUF2254 domain-containing protein [Acidimicrobiales bacterium]
MRMQTNERGAFTEYLRGSLWILPAVAVILALASGAILSGISVEADTFLGRLLFQGDAGAAREVLIIVSATMITVTGVVFSLTVVALQIASSQFSPRLLRNFFRDRPNQIVLAIFVGTFAYSLAGLHTVGTPDEGGEVFVPRLAISGAMFLALLSVAALVYFLHHVAHSIQIDDIMRRVERESLAVLHTLPPPFNGPVPEPPPDARVVRAMHSGYVQATNAEALVVYAATHDLTIRFLPQVGHHLVCGAPLAAVWSPDGIGDPAHPRVEAVVNDGVRIGFERTMEEDVSFGVRQLVDIALRAESPAINDPYTSVQAVQHAAVVLASAAERGAGPEMRSDAAGVPRVVVPRHTLDDYLQLACAQLRRVASHEAAVVVALARLLEAVAQHAREPHEREAIRRQLALLREDAARETRQPADLDEVERGLADVEAALDELPSSAVPLASPSFSRK